MKSINLETAICEEILANIFGTTNSEMLLIYVILRLS